MRVLVVEDEPRMASVIRRSLAKEGLAADVTARGEDCLWMAEAVEYDAIVQASNTLPTQKSRPYSARPIALNRGYSRLIAAKKQKAHLQPPP